MTCSHCKYDPVGDANMAAMLEVSKSIAVQREACAEHAKRVDAMEKVNNAKDLNVGLMSRASSIQAFSKAKRKPRSRKCYEW